jgi:heterodisulfide reductase subunit A-like polyferredoxin
MCTLFPMEVEIDRHQNVTLSAPSKMKRNEDEIRNITAVITKYPCHIWKTNCISCDDLTENSSVEAHNKKFSEDINIKKSIYKPSAQIMPKLGRQRQSTFYWVQTVP